MFFKELKLSSNNEWKVVPDNVAIFNMPDRSGIIEKWVILRRFKTSFYLLFPLKLKIFIQLSLLSIRKLSVNSTLNE